MAHQLSAPAGVFSVRPADSTLASQSFVRSREPDDEELYIRSLARKAPHNYNPFANINPSGYLPVESHTFSQRMGATFITLWGKPRPQGNVSPSISGVLDHLTVVPTAYAALDEVAADKSKSRVARGFAKAGKVLLFVPKYALTVATFIAAVILTFTLLLPVIAAVHAGYAAKAAWGERKERQQEQQPAVSFEADEKPASCCLSRCKNMQKVNETAGKGQRVQFTSQDEVHSDAFYQQRYAAGQSVYGQPAAPTVAAGFGFQADDDSATEGTRTSMTAGFK